jgi:hypothetical protein
LPAKFLRTLNRTLVRVTGSGAFWCRSCPATQGGELAAGDFAQEARVKADRPQRGEVDFDL